MQRERTLAMPSGHVASRPVASQPHAFMISISDFLLAPQTTAKHH